MATTWQEVYVILATEIDATISDVPEDVKHIYEGLLAISALSSFGEGSEISFGTEASVALLDQMNRFYLQARQHYSYDSWRNNMVKSINDFTVRYFGDLTVFVNGLDWSDGCIPFYWEELSRNTRADTNNWIVCS